MADMVRFSIRNNLFEFYVEYSGSGEESLWFGLGHSGKEKEK